MALKMTEERLKLRRTHSDASDQITVEGTAVIPAQFPAIHEVLKCDAFAHLSEATPAEEGDAVEVNGYIDVSITYVAASDAPESARPDGDVDASLEGAPQEVYYAKLENVGSVSALLDAPGSDPGMSAEASGSVVEVRCDVRNDGRTIDVDVVMTVEARVLEEEEVRFVSDAGHTRPRRVRVEKESARVQEHIRAQAVRRSVETLLVLPDNYPMIERSLRLDAKPTVTSAKVSDGKVTVEGHVDYRLFYVPRSSSEVEGAARAAWVSDWSGQTAFEAVLTATGADSDMDADVKVDVERCVSDLEASRRSLRVRADLNVEGALTARRRIDAVTAIEGEADQEVAVRRELLRVEEVAGKTSRQIKAAGMVEIPDGKLPVERILELEARAHRSDVRTADDKVTVSGTIDLDLVFLGHTSTGAEPLQVAHWPDALSFEQTIPMSGVEHGMRAGVNLTVVDVQPDLINRETIEIDVVLQAEAQVSHFVQREVVVEAVEVPPAPERVPSLTYAVVQEGDTLWKLAQRYRTTVEAILEGNPSLDADPDEGRLSIGVKVYVPRGAAA